MFPAFCISGPDMIKYFGTDTAYGENGQPLPALAILNVEYSDGSVIEESKAEMVACTDAVPYPVAYTQVAAMKMAA